MLPAPTPQAGRPFIWRNRPEMNGGTQPRPHAGGSSSETGGRTMETNEIEVELEPDAQPSIYISGELLAYLFGKDDE